MELLEIEHSDRMIFTKKLRPSKDLIRAEQQVLDWIDWVSRHPGYAEEKLPFIRRSYGRVVIGRSDDRIKDAIRARNRVSKNVLEILTYDDIVQRAKLLREKIANS